MNENFTRIPNGYLEGKARYRNLNQEEGCVLMVLERETFGFGRAWAKLSLGYLEEKTGMSKPNLHRALKNLIRKNLILPSDKEVNEYGVQTDPTRWEKISSLSHGTKKVIPSDNEEPLSREIKTIIPSDNKVLSHRITPNKNNKETKKETSKETPYRLWGFVAPKEDATPKAAAPSPAEAKLESEEHALEFSEFWEAYPRKEEKAGAYRCYQGLVKRGHRASELLAAARHYAQNCRNRGTQIRYIKLPATFLGRDKPFLEWVNSPPKPELNLTREVSDFSNAPDGYWQGGVFIPFDDKEEI